MEGNPLRELIAYSANKEMQLVTVTLDAVGNLFTYRLSNAHSKKILNMFLMEILHTVIILGYKMARPIFRILKTLGAVHQYI